MPGLALAFSLAYFVAAGITLAVLHRRIHGIDGHALGLTTVRVLIAGAGTAAVTWVLGDAIGSGGTGEAILALVAGGVVLGTRGLRVRPRAAPGRGAPGPHRAREDPAPGLSGCTPGPAAACNDRTSSGDDDRDQRSGRGPGRREDRRVGIRVVTDSSCDLPAPLVEALGIEIVPLTIRFGSEEYVDQVELSTPEFWRKVQESPQLPETAAPSPGAFESCFRGLIDRGASGIVCINLSSHLSGTMQSAQVAAAAVSGTCPVQVIDSQSASMGLGNLCLTAARRAADGDSLESIVAEVTDRRDRTRLFATLDTLDHIRKSGRIGNARALLGSMLSIKPVIEIRDGVVNEAGRVRTRSKALKLLAAEGGRVEDRAPRGAARQRPRRRRAARPARADLPARRDRHRRHRPGHRHPRRPARHRRHVPGGHAEPDATDRIPNARMTRWT